MDVADLVQTVIAARYRPNEFGPTKPCHEPRSTGRIHSASTRVMNPVGPNSFGRYLAGGRSATARRSGGWRGCALEVDPAYSSLSRTGPNLAGNFPAISA